MKKAAPLKVRVARHFEGVATGLTIRAATDEEVAGGFCGVVQGVALVYNVVDSYGTLFKPGCLDRTRAAKVQQRKVKFYLDHIYQSVKTHVGTILSLDDRGDAAVMTAGIFNTAAGREAKEYLEAVLASDSETGLSVGFYERAAAYEPDSDGDSVYAFSEIELDETSLTPRNAVPGALVTGVRMEDQAADKTEASERLLALLVQTLPAERVRSIVNAATTGRTDAGGTPAVTAPAAALDPATGQPAPHASSEDSAKRNEDGPDGTKPAGVPVHERLATLRTVLATLN